MFNLICAILCKQIIVQYLSITFTVVLPSIRMTKLGVSILQVGNHGRVYHWYVPAVTSEIAFQSSFEAVNKECNVSY